MLYFSFSNYREFTGRKKNSAKVAQFNADVEKVKNMLQKRAEKRAERAKRIILNAERHTLVKKATARMFTPERAVTAIRAELSASPELYANLNLQAKDVTRAYLIVIGDDVCTLTKVTLNNDEWTLRPVQSVREIVKSLEQKRKLVALADKAIKDGKIPPYYKARTYVADLIKSVHIAD